MKNYPIIFAGIIGNAIETYDLTIYPFLIPYMAKIFFPNQSWYGGLINVFSIFFFGYLFRPIGSLFFGFIGDVYGRKKTLLWSNLLMMIATGMMGLLPTYQMGGYTGALVLLILRMLQGFSFGGEYTGSVIYLVEHADYNKRNTFGSFAALGSNMGILMAAITSLVITIVFSEQQILSGLWRIPFLLSLFFSVICFILRSYIQEPRNFNKVLINNKIDRRSLLCILKHIKMQLLLIITLTWFGVVVTYMFFVYLVPYLVKMLHYSMQTALMLNIISITLLVMIIPFAGCYADKVNRKKIIPICIIALAILIVPYLYLVTTSHYYLIFFTQIAISIPAAFYFVTVPVLLVELVQTSVRCRSVSIGYNIAAAIFGGTTPLITLTLVEKTHLNFIPGIYLIICGGITFYILKISKNYPSISV